MKTMYSLFGPGLTTLVMVLLLATAHAADATFIEQPTDTTVVAGHQGQMAFATLTEQSLTSIQWYRNDVAIAGATSNPYQFTATSGDAGQYHAVVAGQSKLGGPFGPTATAKATLTVLPASIVVVPAITSPAPGAVIPRATSNADTWTKITATGNGLKWSYRYSTDAAGTWKVMTPPYDTTKTTYYDGANHVLTAFVSSALGTTVTVRVIDDAGLIGSRTWTMEFTNAAPVNNDARYVPPFYVAYVGQTLVVDAAHGLKGWAKDFDGDPLTFRSDGTWPGLIIQADGSFRYTPPALSVSTWDAYKALISQGQFAYSYYPGVLAGKYICNDGTTDNVANDQTGRIIIMVVTGPGDLNRDGGISGDDLDFVIPNLGKSNPIPAP